LLAGSVAETCPKHEGDLRMARFFQTGRLGVCHFPGIYRAMMLSLLARA
jgi:hypothetical protein